MGITNINKQQASQKTQTSPWASRGLAVNMDGTKHTTPGAGSVYALVPLDLSALLMKYNKLTKPAPRTTPKPVQLKASKTATTKNKPWYIRLFESIRWAPGPKY